MSSWILTSKYNEKYQLQNRGRVRDFYKISEHLK
jgi:hypothetical protein